MTLNPEQEQGQVNPEAGGTEVPAAEPTTETPTGPFKQFATQAEYEAHFGTRATEARQSYARKHGYQTIQEMDAALAAHKQREDADKTELERANTELEQLRPAAQENLTLKQERAADRALLAADVDPKKLDDVMVLLKAQGIPLDEANNVDSAALTANVNSLLERHPYFKGKGASIGTGSNPAQGTNVPAAKNPWSKDSRNLTEQARITREDPALAARMKAAAKK